jgi:hypothetical protein
MTTIKNHKKWAKSKLFGLGRLEGGAPTACRASPRPSGPLGKAFSVQTLDIEFVYRIFNEKLHASAGRTFRFCHFSTSLFSCARTVF